MVPCAASVEDRDGPPQGLLVSCESAPSLTRPRIYLSSHPAYVVTVTPSHEITTMARLTPQHFCKYRQFYLDRPSRDRRTNALHSFHPPLGPRMPASLTYAPTSSFYRLVPPKANRQSITMTVPDSNKESKAIGSILPSVC